MDFDMTLFQRRLDTERATGNSAARFIQEEIRKAEEMKVGLSEENDHASEFVSEAINRIDTYVFQLHELERQCDPAELELDQQTYLEDDKMHHRIADRIDRLKEQGEANASNEDELLRQGKEEE